jgi:glycosyltransferase involved in cell wall biosynthesis
MVARTRYTLPLPPGRARKFAALREQFELRVLATSADGRQRDDGIFHLVGRMPALDGPLFWLLLPLRVRRLVRSHDAEVILAQSPYEALLAGLAAGRARVVVEIHGDWRTATRLYGSPLRRLLSPATDALGRLGLRRAAAVRSLSPFTSGLVREAGVEPVAEFEAFVDLEAFVERPNEPVPGAPAVVFVGVLERYKNIDGLVAAWRAVSARVPEARLHLIGTGTLVPLAEDLVRAGCTWDRRLDPAEVAAAIDGARALLLPSASEGLPRVAIEAFVRGRAVVGTRAGGIPDIVEDGATGLLVEPGDVAGLAAAIERIVTDQPLAERLGAAALAASGQWISTPEDHARRVRAVVDQALGR